MKILIALSTFLSLSSSFAMSIPKDAYTFDFNIKTISMSRLKEDKIQNSVDLLKEIFASPEFKQRILVHKFNGQYRFSQNRGYSNFQIYQKILAGVEKLYPYYNNAMDVEVELYTDYNSQVLGYTRPSTKRIWMNTKYFNKHTPAQVASHLTHEWLHKLGFDHEKEKCVNRKYSVPYAVGYIIKDLAERIDEGRNQDRSQKRQRGFRSRQI
jgi:hypothetical protein